MDDTAMFVLVDIVGIVLLLVVLVPAFTEFWGAVRKDRCSPVASVGSTEKE